MTLGDSNMEPKNRWLIMGGIAVIGAFAFLYIRGRKATASTTASPVLVSSGPPADLSTVSNIPEVGVNMGNLPPTGSGFNGLGAAGTPLVGSTGTTTTTSPPGSIDNPITFPGAVETPSNVVPPGGTTFPGTTIPALPGMINPIPNNPPNLLLQNLITQYQNLYPGSIA